MKIFLTFVIATVFVAFATSNLTAQTGTTQTDTSTVILNNTVQPEVNKMNFIKINLLALPLRTITLQYERVINKFLSVAIAGRYMPEANVPYKNWIYKRFGDNDPEFKETLDNMFISNFAFTPEVRFYLGKKGYGKGFYLAPAYRFAHFELKNIEYTFTDSEDQDNAVNMSGTMNSNFGGFTVGAQWFLGKHLSLDWWIFAPFFGVENTKLSGTTSEALSEEDQDILREDILDLDIPYTTTEVEVHEYGANIKFHGLMAGVSTGLAFAVRF